ncbi:substrate-binding domain-containing protein [Bacillus mangrovi]|uniref:Substrate-binding domain-containing protein n=1 Tax=Metabacillus mangrovi TaxID=1491830 RepID=A0A7X2V5L9_9BACI|nr:sugar-binding protein [Metabacillus mangrovi]MTH54585.1 substrate-binding domain-containing protein [Metabacillus mangrovi]
MAVLKRILYVSAILIFLITAGMTVYFGKETFHVTSAAADPSEQKKSHFVLIPEELDNDYWELVKDGAMEMADHNGVILEYLGPKQANVEEHLRTIDMAIAGKVDGLMTQGIENEEFTKLLNKAVDKGIPVITIDTDAPESDREVYVGTDNYYAGQLAGKALIRDTKGPQTVGIITGRFEASNQKLRVQGFLDAIKGESRIRVASVKESDITRAGAVNAALKFYQEVPDITAFYGTSALDAIGIAQLTEYLKKDVCIIGFDTLPETIRYIEKGTIRATIVQYPYEMGAKGVETLLNMQKGEKQKAIQHTGTKVIRKTDLPLIPIKPEGAAVE